jgi:hypothetical protein
MNKKVVCLLHYFDLWQEPDEETDAWNNLSIEEREELNGSAVAAGLILAVLAGLWFFFSWIY